MHTHLGVLHFAIIAAYIIIFGAIWRTVTAWLTVSDNPLGPAMAYVF